MTTAAVAAIFPFIPFPEDGPDGIGVFHCRRTGKLFLDSGDRVFPMVFLQYPEANGLGVSCAACDEWHAVKANRFGPTLMPEIVTKITHLEDDRSVVAYTRPAVSGEETSDSDCDSR